MKSYKASDKNDVNGDSATPGTASGRGFELSPIVIKRNPQSSTCTKHQTPPVTNISFNIRRIVGDGNCLFRSVSLYLYNTQDKYMELREKAVLDIRRHWNELKEYLVLSRSEPIDRRSYFTLQDKMEHTVRVLISWRYQKYINSPSGERIKNDQYATHITPTIINRTKKN